MEEKTAISPLTPDMVSEPGLHRLVLSIGTDSLQALIVSRVNENSVLYRSIPLAADARSVTALEEAVYANPLLTADFHSVDIVIDNNRFFFMDARKAEDASEVNRRIELLWPAGQQTMELAPLVNEVETDRTVLVTAVERALTAFVRRTWHRPVIRHRMAVLTRYHGLKNHLGNMGKIHAYVMPDRLDLMIYGREGLYMANSFKINGTDDAAFYTLAAAKHFDFDNETDRLLVEGVPAAREALIESLRRFVVTVLPQIRPSGLPAAAPPDTPVSLLLTLVV